MPPPARRPGAFRRPPPVVAAKPPSGVPSRGPYKLPSPAAPWRTVAGRGSAAWITGAGRRIRPGGRGPRRVPHEGMKNTIASVPPAPSPATPTPQSPGGAPAVAAIAVGSGIGDLLTVEQAAAHLQVSPSSIRSYIREGRLKAFRVAGLRAQGAHPPRRTARPPGAGAAARPAGGRAGDGAGSSGGRLAEGKTASAAVRTASAFLAAARPASRVPKPGSGAGSATLILRRVVREEGERGGAAWW
jgi:excisionase family DNA binding protein